MTMRIGVISDTHGNLARARRAIEAMGEIDLLLHAGDHYRDGIALVQDTKAEIFAVPGNCDPKSVGPQEKFFTVEGKNILLTHGHHYHVKHDYAELAAWAKVMEADIVVFGHTHVPAMVVKDRVLYFNPGSVGLPRGSYLPTYGVIEIKNDGIFPHIYQIKMG